MMKKEDELASLERRVPGNPLVSGGTSFVTHRLDSSHPQHWVFRTSASFRTAVVLLFLAGAGLAGRCLFSGKSENSISVLGAMGAVFLLTGAILLWNGSRRAQFDFKRQYYWKDRRRPKNGNAGELRESLPFREIAALQLVGKFCRGSRGYTFCSYELNLVKCNGSRLNVTSHGGKKAIEEDAARLAERLHVPLWGLETKTHSGPEQKIGRKTE